MQLQSNVNSLDILQYNSQFIIVVTLQVQNSSI